MRLRNVYYTVVDPLPDDTWVQIVLVFDSGPRAAVHRYIKGDVKHGDTALANASAEEASSGHVVIGRRHVDSDSRYCSTMVDELILWNRSLTSREAEYIISLY